MIKKLWLSFFLFVIPALFSAQTLDQWVESFRNPTLGQGIQVTNKALSFEHLELNLSGQLYPVMTGDRLSGVYFSGNGRFVYTSEDPYEAPIFSLNVKEGSSYRVENSSINDSFGSLLIMMSTRAEELFESEVLPEGSAPPSVTQALEKHQQRWSHDRFWRSYQLIPQALAEKAPSQVLVAEIKASKHDVVFTLDPLRDDEEYLAVMRQPENPFRARKHRRYPVYLSIQALSRPNRLEPRKPRFQLKDLDVTVVNSGGREAKISVRETVVAKKPLRTLDFSLSDSIMGSTGPRATPTELFYRVDTLQDKEGNPLVYSHLNGDLVVELPEVLNPGESFTLQLELSGDILYRPGNDNYWRIPGSWYPSPHQWGMEAFAYHAVVKVPTPFTPFSSGKTLRRWEEDGFACAEFEQTTPISGPVIMAGKYYTLSENREGRTVRVSTYASKNKSASKTLTNLVYAFIDFYEPYLGQYPFQEIDLIEINSLGFGQAPPNIIYITQEAFVSRRDVLTQIYSEGVNARLAHEVAHGWWGHVAMLSSLENQWLSESIADYYGALAMMNLKRKTEFKKAMAGWKRGARESEGKGSIYMGNFTVGKERGAVRRELLYERGPLMLHALRQEIGDDAFFTIMKSFLRSFPYQPSQTKDFVDLTNYITKKDYGPWFDKYLFGTEVPEVKK